MKATLEFDLAEEREEFNATLKAGALMGAAQEYDNYLRGRLKYEAALDPEAGKAIQAARDAFHDAFQGLLD